MIQTGRYGTVKYDPAAVTPVVVASLNGWKLSLKTDYEEVTCFGDSNKVYVPGLKDVSGTLSGFWDSDDTTLVDAADATTPGLLELAPNSSALESAFKWSGLAYMDADIDCSLSAPKLSGTFKAAGPWTRAGTLAAGPTAGPTKHAH
jgi:hypothetical protein